MIEHNNICHTNNALEIFLISLRSEEGHVYHAMATDCEDSHLCFGVVDESKHHEYSHTCFGRRQPTTLSPLEVVGVSSVIEDAISQLLVLRQTLPIDKGAQWNEDFQDLETRFSASPRPPKIFPELAGLWPTQIASMLKIQQDRGFAETILSNTLEELKTQGTFAVLRSSMDWQWAMAADERALLSMVAERMDSAQALVKKLKAEETNLNAQSKFWDEKKDLLTTTLHDTYLISGLSMKWTHGWETARREQHMLTLRRKEDVLRDKIEKALDQGVADEGRAHLEIVRYIDLDLETLKKNLDVWTDVYDEEMNKRETDLLVMKNSREQQLEDHAELRAEAQHRKQIMKDAVLLRTQYEEKQKAVANVVAIQAWWRGVSFRHGFDKVKKKKKGKKKGKGRKGKGKTKKK